MTEPKTIPDAVGAYVSRVRREHRLTLDQIAGAARSCGASWSASSVSNIERGQASLTLPTLLFLALALGNLMGRPLTLSNLLGDAEILALSADDRHPVKRSWVDAALRGEEVTMSPDTGAVVIDTESDDELDETLEDEVLAKMSETRGREISPAEKDGQVNQLIEQSQMPPEPTRRTSNRSAAGSLAEERAAKKLGITTARLRQLAHELWARSLEAEALTRAGVDSTPQARGRVTRVLVEEILESTKEGR